MSKLEKEVESRVYQWCKRNGVLFIKFTPMGSRGWPDRICIFPGGLHVWLELKRKGKTLRKLQEYRAELLENQGAITMWADDAKACIEELQACLDDAKEVMNEMDT
jgi:hypothetical protein